MADNGIQERLEVTEKSSGDNDTSDKFEVDDGSGAYNDEQVEPIDSKARCNPFCNVFDGVAEAEGYAATGVGKGATLMSSVFLTPSLVYLAEQEAGCGEVSGNDCTNTIYGLRPSSLIPMVAVVGGLVSAFILPLVGATIDFTPHRKAVGIVASGLLATVAAVQIGTVAATWFPMMILQAVAVLGYDIQNTASTAYFPELVWKVGEKRTTRYQASMSICIFVTEIFYLLVITGLSIALNLSTVRTAQVGQAVCAPILIMAFGYGWWRLPHVPALHPKPEGSTVVSSGFRQTIRTLKGINMHYGSTLRWFFVATCFAEAGSNSFTSLSVTYMTVVLQTTGSEIGIVFMTTLVFSSLGSKLGSLITKKFNPILSMQLALIIFAAVTIIGGFVLTSPERKMLLYVFGPLWGLVLGWQYTAQHTFFSLCLPKGQEAELSGIYTYCQIILNWLPPLIFSAINEAGVPMQYALMTITIFLFMGVLIQGILLAPWDECRKLSDTISKNIDKRTSLYADEAAVAAAKALQP